MKQNFYYKMAFILALIIALMIPRAFISDLVGERQGWRQQAFDSIGQSWPGRQTVAGPILRIPYQLTYHTKEKIINANKTVQEVVKEATCDDVLYIIPKQLHIRSKVDSSRRYRGIYEVPVYVGVLEVVGEFSTQPMLDFAANLKDAKIRWDKPQLSVLIRDQRGIALPPKLTWNGASVTFQPGSHLAGTAAGMHAVVPGITGKQEIRIAFSFSMELKGMQGMSLALLSENTEVNLEADWPDPSFTGELLPEKREVTEKGFTAEWRASSFSFDVTAALENCRKGNCQELLNRAVGFDLMQPVDSYQQSERSIKYAELFIVLTFVVLILFELLKKLRVHPIQYALVGMALLMFYLLLISLSEHIPFHYAYTAGALACTGLLTFYFGAILHSRKLGVMLGAGISTLYAVLYVILRAEENALLMGSLLLFAVLAGLMLVTRHLDWYALTGQGSLPDNDVSARQTDKGGV
jgi:inner membrane protein